MMNIYQNYTQYSHCLCKQGLRRCCFLWMLQKMSAFSCKDHRFSLSPAGSNLFDPALRQNTDYWTISQRTMMQSDDKLHRWWINVTIRSLILPSQAEQKVDSDCDKSEWVGFPLARFWVLKSFGFVGKLKVLVNIAFCFACYGFACSVCSILSWKA